MKSFIRKIFDDEMDESVHMQFQKFGKGEFKERALIVVKNSGGTYTISTGPEYARDLIMALGEKLGEGRTFVSGALISALDLDGFEYKEKKSAIGVRKYIIESEMSGNQIVELCQKIPKAFFGLSFAFEDYDLKIKTKSPKSTKGVSSQKKDNDKLKVDFCKLKTSDKKIVMDLAFDVEKDFKKIEISHEFIIEDIVISDEIKSSCGRDFALIREKVLRKGKVIRKVSVDGLKKVSEKEFEA